MGNLKWESTFTKEGNNSKLISSIMSCPKTIWDTTDNSAIVPLSFYELK